MKVPDCIILTPRHEVYAALLISLVLGGIVARGWVAGRELEIQLNEADYEGAIR